MGDRARSVLFLITGLDYGGAEEQLLQLSRRLQQRGRNVRVVGISAHGRMLPEFAAAGITATSLRTTRKLAFTATVRRLAEIIREFRPDVLHSHLFHANILARVIRRAAPVPVVISTAHSAHAGGWVRRVAYQATRRLPDLTTNVSEAAVREFVRLRLVAPDAICCIPNGVDTRRFAPSAEARERIRNALGIGERFVWIAVGRFHPAKDYPLLLRSFATHNRKEGGAVLLIAGDGPQRNELQGLAQRLGVEESVRWLGLRRDVPALLSAADGYVLSSVWEGLPMALLEAAAAELPIVATRVGGNEEIVDDGRSGVLVPPGHADMLSDALLRIESAGVEARASMGRAGRGIVVSHYELGEIARRWECVYDRLYRDHGQAGRRRDHAPGEKKVRSQ